MKMSGRLASGFDENGAGDVVAGQLDADDLRAHAFTESAGMMTAMSMPSSRSCRKMALLP
jgi:hypothetical protein